tara:strand:+ start:1097 stop:1291 length:195 start_codon:yes stop_codon:yes gene_type:complete
MKIAKDMKVEKFRQTLTDLDYIVKDSDKQLQYILNNHTGEIKLSFDKDGKTITGYQYVRASQND